MKCKFCGRSISYDTSQCPSCGAPCDEISSPASDRPQSSDVSASKTDDPGAVKKFGSVDVSFLRSSKAGPAEDEKLLNDFIKKKNDPDHAIAKTGCIFAIVLIAAIVLFVCCKLF